MTFFEDDAAKSFSKILARFDSISDVTSISIRLFSGNAPSPEMFRLMICSLALFKIRTSSRPEDASTVRSCGTVNVAVIFLSVDDAVLCSAAVVSVDVSAPDAIVALFAGVSFVAETVAAFASVVLSADASVGEVST